MTEDYSYKEYTFLNPMERFEEFSDSSITEGATFPCIGFLSMEDAVTRLLVSDAEYGIGVTIKPELHDLLWFDKTSEAIAVIEIKNFEETDFSRKIPAVLDSLTGLRLVGLPPYTPATRLTMLGDDVDQIVKLIGVQEYGDALNRLTTLNSSIRNLILSGDLNEEMSNDLNLLSASMDSAIKIVYEGMRQQNVVNSIKDNEIVAFLQGVEKTLKAFSDVC